MKSSSTKELLRIDIDLCRRWMEYQETTKLNWCGITYTFFDVSKDEGFREAFNLKNT